MMMTRVAQGLALLVCGAGVVLGCSSSIETTSPSGSRASSTERVGRIGLQLQPVAGITVTGLHYTVTQGAPSAASLIVSEGNLPTPGTASNISFGLPLPVGSGYFVSLSGVSAELNDNITCSGMVGPVEVQANVSTAISLQLTCVDNSNGQALVSVDVETDACPRLIVDYAVAEPAEGWVGKSIKVFAGAHDLDNAAEPIKYTWSIVEPAMAAVGTFAPANTRDSSFLCQANGYAIRIRVTAENHECRKSLETVVKCGESNCGNGVVELEGGETCDWRAGPGHPADPTCPLDCTKVCGDGFAEGDEECDPLPNNPAVCNPPGQPNACKTRVGQLTGQPGSLAICGDGIRSGNEECDPGSGFDHCCSTSCESLCPPGCLECEEAGDCVFSVDNCFGPPSAPFTLAQQKICTDVMQCVQDSNCMDSNASLGRCYCGTLGIPACVAAPFDLSQPGTPNGACAKIMQVANPDAISNERMLAGLINKSRPGGAAGQRLSCQKIDPVCAPLCGLQ
jgi:hypothetical protein